MLVYIEKFADYNGFWGEIRKVIFCGTKASKSYMGILGISTFIRRIMMPASKNALRGHRRICLGISQDKYETVVNNHVRSRELIDNAVNCHPELFPAEIHNGYELKDSRISKKLNVKVRRILVAGVSYSILPSFVMPYMTGFAKDVEKPLFLRKFALPFWAICHCFGKNEMYWYRIEVSLGRNSLVGTTIRSAQYLPRHVCADEKHTRLLGRKAYIPLTVARECVLGAGVVENANRQELQMAYGVFKQEARDINPDYSPQTVNTDGWRATVLSWLCLFKNIRIISCFLHIFIAIRDRSSKKHRDDFLETSEKLWDCYHSETKSSFSQKVRRLYEWSKNRILPPVIADKIEKLHKNRALFSIAYDHPGAHRTSNMIDRSMRNLDRFLFSIQGFHGKLLSANMCVRSWALIHNFAPSNPNTILKYDGLKSPAERINDFRYHDNWLENLLISASLKGYRSSPQKTL